MNPNQTAAYQALAQAQQAMKQGDKRAARQFAELAAQSAPELEDVWLVMAALATPHASVEYLQKALQINPQSERAQKGMLWAEKRLRQEQAEKAQQQPQPQPVIAVDKQPAIAEKPADTQPVVRALPATVAETQPAKSTTQEAEREKPAERATPVAIAAPRRTNKTQTTRQPQKSMTRPRVSYAVILAVFICLVSLVAIWKNVTPASAFFDEKSSGPAWAQANISKSIATPSPLPVEAPTLTALPIETFLPTETALPTATPVPTETFTPTATNTPPPTPTETPTITETPTPTIVPSATDTEGPSPTPLPTDTAAPTFAVPTKSPIQAKNPAPAPGVGGGEHWIDVNLSQQMVYAYEGNTLVNSFVVSTGTWRYPTVTGQYRVYIKYRYKDMSGPGYYLPNVPYTMFFYRGYALHGTYWHNNFGTPMSHGCINLSIPDSQWLYNFSSVGTLVNVHY